MLREILARLFDKLKKLRERFINLKLPGFLNPINSIRQLVLWFLVFGGIPFIAGNLIQWFSGTGVAIWDTITLSRLLVVILWANSEEALFRFFPKLALGNSGLLVGTIVWILMHPFNTTPPLWGRIPTDVSIGIFYIKLWRGKYWWLSFLIHPLWNFAVIFLWQWLKIYI